jgi:hypothetical protein
MAQPYASSCRHRDSDIRIAEQAWAELACRCGALAGTLSFERRTGAMPMRQIFRSAPSLSGLAIAGRFAGGARLLKERPSMISPICLPPDLLRENRRTR